MPITTTISDYALLGDCQGAALVFAARLGGLVVSSEVRRGERVFPIA